MMKLKLKASPGLKIKRFSLNARRVCTVAMLIMAGATQAAVEEPAIDPPRSVPLAPEFDPSFYQQPQEALQAATPGKILAARQVILANFGLLPLNEVDAWQIAYRSNDSRDQPITAVATLIKPRGTASQPRKLFSLQIAEDSTAGYCAPSYALQFLSVAPLAGQIIAPIEFVFAQAALQQGYAVIIPDHEGPNSAYAAGPLGARITLDGIRAATRFPQLGSAPQAAVALYGYSGGTMPTGHAAEIAADYAPELNIVGVAEGGVGADLKATLNKADGQFTSGLVLAALQGLSREYPEVAEYLRQNADPGMNLLMDAKAPLCVAYQSVLLPFLNLTQRLHTEGAPALESMFAETKMGRQVPHIPLFIWHAGQDEILPREATDELVDTYCRDPEARVQYTIDGTNEHIITEIDGGPSALLWLRDRLEGVPAEQGCSIREVGSMLGSQQQTAFSTAFGEGVAGRFGKAKEERTERAAR